ncbi:hypothetical protein DNHGIG_23180 [Collibacillus ludicampi]|uniref:Uncharacterized protein n=1 Tax=Collibacillus ludicampi TaxID=2771369 RepID=A0AAV4LG25_9BACL|nr:hypothetical protein DNHGIG_23180 [Collibacillus ludicampi]
MIMVQHVSSRIDKKGSEENHIKKYLHSVFLDNVLQSLVLRETNA